MYVRRLLAACLLLGALLLVLSFVSGGVSAAGDDANFASDPIDVPSSQDIAIDNWTVMVYLDADNNLESYALEDFMEMSNVISSSDVNILVQMDRTSSNLDHSSEYDGWTNCSRFNVTHGMTPTLANAVQYLGEVDMGAPDTLSSFIIWSMTNYPADHYLLVLWDHGGGWGGVCQDFTSSYDILTLPELSTAMGMVNASFADFKVDIIGYDACLMGETEVYYEIKDHADYFVGSEINIPGYGWDYETSLARLVADPDMNASALASYIAGDYIDFYSSEYASDVTMSVVDARAIDDLMVSLDALADEMADQMEHHYDAIVHCRTISSAFSDDELLDLQDFAHNLAQNGPTATIRQLASQVYNDTVDCIIFNEVNDENGDDDLSEANGLTIFFPTIGSSLSGYDSDGLQFTADSSWDEMLTIYHTDLTITDYYLEDVCGDEVTDATYGHQTAICVTIANTGDVSASSFDVCMYIDGSQVYLWSDLTLAAGATITEQYSFTYFEIDGHNITIVIDQGDDVSESNETNNEVYWEFDVVNAKYTVLIYMDGDNNLEYYQINNFLDMASVGSSAEVTIIVQFDRISNAQMSAAGISSDYYETRYGDWSVCLRFYVTEGMTPTVANAVQNLGEVDMGDDAVLEDFLLWGVENYQADDYIVILKDHGAAWYGCCADDTSDSILSMSEMSYALSSMVNKTGAPIDILVMDDCLMGTIEVAAQLNDLALYAVVSETYGWTSNIDYSDLATYIENNLDDTGEQMAIAIADMEHLVDSPSDSTQCMAAYDLTLTDSLLTAFEAYLDDLYQCWLDDPSAIVEARSQCDELDVAYGDDTLDLYQFVQLTMERCGNDTLNVTGQALLDLLDDGSASPFILDSRTTASVSFCHGMSIYFPWNSSTYYHPYDSSCDLVYDSDWNEFLADFLSDSPPATEAVLSGTLGSNSWYASSVGVSFTVYDPTSLGTTYLNYSIDGGSWTQYTGGFSITAEGTHTISFYATGENGAVEAVQNVIVKVDKTDPTASASVSGMTVTLSGSDDLSGLSYIRYRIDDGAWQTYSSAITVAADGYNHTVYYYATDNASNTGVIGSVVVGDDDTIAPETTAEVEGTSGNDGWYVGHVNVTLNATDDGGSGLDVIYYSIDDGAWTEYNGTLELNTTGTYELTYYARDNFGNNESQSTLVIKVDLDAPMALVDLTGTGAECYNGTVSASFEGQDEGSGVSVVQYRLDGGPWTNATGFDLTDEGTFLLEWRAVDIAGNVGPISNLTISIDLTAPTCTIELDGTEDGWSDGVVTVTLEGEDDGPADLYLEYQVNEGDWTVYTGPIAFDEDGTYEVVCRAIDTAGNVGAMVNETFAIDTVAPRSALAAEGMTHDGSYVNSVTISIAATDDGVGVASTFYKLDDGTWTELNGSLTVSTVGDHTLNYYSVDGLGNIEDEIAFNLSIAFATVPGQVTVLTLEDELTEQGWVNVSWTAPSDGGLEILHYLVYRADAGSTDYGLIANVTGTWYHDLVVTEGATADYYVVAVNALGQGNASSVEEIVTEGGDEGMGIELWMMIGAVIVAVVAVAVLMVLRRHR